MIKKLSKSGGFTLIEIIIVLAIIGMLAGILAPTMIKYVQSAKLRRATDDVKMIGTAIGNFYNDTGEWPIWTAAGVTAGMTGAGTTTNNYEVLVGPGDDITNATYGTITSKGTLEDQLGINGPRYPTTGAQAWRGPYIEQFRPDPWGNAYVVNVKWLWPQYEVATNDFTPVFVLSGGPNKRIETTALTQRTTPATFTPGGDDIVFRIK